MELTPEERRKIYEEEKARLEAREQLEREKSKIPPENTTGLAPNVTGLLCYLGFWITGGIVFVVGVTLFVRFLQKYPVTAEEGINVSQ